MQNKKKLFVLSLLRNSRLIVVSMTKFMHGVLSTVPVVMVLPQKGFPDLAVFRTALSKPC